MLASVTPLSLLLSVTAPRVLLLPSLDYLNFFFKCIHFYMDEYFAGMYVQYMCAMPTEARRGCLTPRPAVTDGCELSSVM